MHSVLSPVLLLGIYLTISWQASGAGRGTSVAVARRSHHAVMVVGKILMVKVQ